MAKLTFKQSVIQSAVIPNLDEGIKFLNYAINSFNSLSIPSDFSHRSTLENIREELSVVKNNLNNDEKWLNKSISTLNKLENEFSEQAIMLPKNDLKIRSNYIK